MYLSKGENNMGHKFGMLSNKIFYTQEEGELSILEQLKKKDGKVILILYYLFRRKDIDRKTYITLKQLLNLCNYKEIGKNRISFKEILYKLKEIEIIDFQQEIKDKNTFLEIDCSNLIDEDDGYFNFFKLEEEEIELIRSSTTNNQNFMTDFKVYCYLKARVKKIDKDRNIFERGMSESETTWRSFDDITKHTGVRAIEKSIRNLKEIGLIDYVNAGVKLQNGIYLSCNNIYALTRVSKHIDLELKEGLKQYLYYEEKKGNKIIKNNDNYIKQMRKEGGTKKALIEKIKKGIAIKEEIERYKQLEQMQQERQRNKNKAKEELHKKIGLQTIKSDELEELL